ncbi:uncharacterized protein SPPG_08612 [Spizellomyces punctatus DAOM BR117]|uniref:Complex 1 LYR protein domain-containing protein n=1 Tax=Spizellomyces punctatus (strain DAOM BR117) TaxID=645134 RepID=A0A0L0H521_SPIPD|nr:uncharacterized protein SPPG_08612 [Spizellomyces punctatus DAOM BR117]KNC96016.1 hypothetical protein SPPG_08612 [Spizellomyces punctatus DAOM BR117]|eukprot:XP_016604056.1 hypothetical protein SPPG_08612 [Spizellomyces punctatus DAOM BR117]
MSLRGQVRSLYKQLLFIGREYPAGFEFYRARLKAAFLKKRDLSDPEDIRKALRQGEFVLKELEALWFLKKYRHLKQKYYDQ